MGDAIVNAAGLVESAVPLLRSISAEAARLSSIAEEITKLEDSADDVHDIGLKELFRAQSATSPMAFVIGSEIYDHLEDVVDRFDDVANEINNIVIDHV